MPNDAAPAYAELHAVSNFTFLRGASHPKELVARAQELGYAALALTDECSLAGVVRAHVAAKAAAANCARSRPEDRSYHATDHTLRITDHDPFKLIIGSEFRLADGLRLMLLASERGGYGNLSELITTGRRAAAKGSYHLTRENLADGVPGCLALWAPSIGAALGREISRRAGAAPTEAGSLGEQARWLADTFPGRAWITVELLHSGGDPARLEALTRLGHHIGLPLVAAGDVHMHVRDRRALQDTLTAVRLGTTVQAAGLRLYPNGERCLRRRRVLARIYPPALLDETLRIAERCNFSLDELRYEYPQELVPPGETPAGYLRRLTENGMRERWPDATPPKVRELVEHELRLIGELNYEPYFLTVHDIVKFARARNILCQGRGSAANSAVCFCLGITAVDPARMDMLFERFISKERNEPPDIDVDFEHGRREEVIQYIYKKYGRRRAALAATVITYRPRSAIRDVGKALGLSLEQVDRLAKSIQWWDGKRIAPAHLKEAGFDPGNPVITRVVQIVNTLIGFPRHLSQHVGGFVIARGSLARLVPIENAAMQAADYRGRNEAEPYTERPPNAGSAPSVPPRKPAPNRTVIQWDKDDLDALGLLKIDCLGLGMLSAIHRAFDLIETFRGRKLSLASLPAEDPEVYRMIQKADTVGVFQIESRAQMAMLPRLRPASFYDLVIEVAIVRPGPIQGDMVHPYLRRRQGLEPVTYPSEAVRKVLERTLGIPIFQEQVIKLAMVAAGFTPGEADSLRRSMAAWRRRGGLEAFEQRLIDGMRDRGYSEEFARRIFRQIQGFGEYGFPECVVGETRVVDADTGRWLTIDEVLAGRSPLRNTLACDEDLRLRRRRVLAIAPSGVKPVFQLHTALGHTITATAEHPFLTMRGWRRLGKLQVGDYIAAARSLPSLGRGKWPRHRIIVLADLIAEGNLYHPSTFYFYTTDPLHRDEFVRAVERFPNTRATVARHRSCFSVHVRRANPDRLSGAVAWAQELGLWGCNARAKRLPVKVFELRDADIALLLARLWEGDGGFSTAGHASYDSVSRQLAEEIQHLLLRLGIVARLYRHARPYRDRQVESYVVTVTGKDPLRQFWRRIARRFLGPEKRRLARALATCTEGRLSRDVIPIEVREIIRRERYALGLTWNAIGRMTGLGMREIQARGGSKGGFRRFVIARLVDCFCSRGLARLADSQLYWDKVVAIEPFGHQQTYDLRIEEDHNFLANNLVVHNSHAASFAWLTYISAWLKRFEPAAFTCALLNSQPMGFYAPTQLVQDARRHGVKVQPVDVRFSSWDCTLEEGSPPSSPPSAEGVAKAFVSSSSRERDQDQPTLRLGLRMVKGLSQKGAVRLVRARANRAFGGVSDLARRAHLNRRDLEALAAAGAFAGLTGNRHQARWAVAGVEAPLPLFCQNTEAIPMLRPPTEGEDIVADYASLGLTLRRHPLAVLRPRLDRLHLRSAMDIGQLCHGEKIRTAGLVVCRQCPSSASGVIFVTLEDETGTSQVIVWPSLAKRQRRELLTARLLGVAGEIQREGDVLHVIAKQLEDHSALLGNLVTPSRDFH